MKKIILQEAIGDMDLYPYSMLNKTFLSENKVSTLNFDKAKQFKDFDDALNFACEIYKKNEKGTEYNLFLLECDGGHVLERHWIFNPYISETHYNIVMIDRNNIHSKDSKTLLRTYFLNHYDQFACKDSSNYCPVCIFDREKAEKRAKFFYGRQGYQNCHFMIYEYESQGKFVGKKLVLRPKNETED